jgi:predicted RNA-binding Zn-ribbon protein involved in translation (DUF1610 family)
MGAFNTQKIINASPSLIPAMANKITTYFRKEGYDTDVQVSDLGTHDISISKGGMFKAVLGLKTALKITLKPESDRVYFEAGIGIFGQQIIPALVMLFVAWPVILTQAWGIAKQAQLDDLALTQAESVIPATGSTTRVVEPTSISFFCPNCGHKHNASMHFCPNCGQKLLL